MIYNPNRAIEASLRFKWQLYHVVCVLHIQVCGYDWYMIRFHPNL